MQLEAEAEDRKQAKEKEKRRKKLITSLNVRIKNLQADNFALSEHLENMTQDRDRYRKIFHTRMLWWVDLMESKQYPSLPHMVKEDMKLLTRCEKANL